MDGEYRASDASVGKNDSKKPHGTYLMDYSGAGGMTLGTLHYISYGHC